jgi:hypothetical protein
MGSDVEMQLNRLLLLSWESLVWVYCGVDELAFMVAGLDLRELRPSSSTYDYVCNPLSKNLAKLAVVNVYSYFMIGTFTTRKSWNNDGI